MTQANFSLLDSYFIGPEVFKAPSRPLNISSFVVRNFWEILVSTRLISVLLNVAKSGYETSTCANIASKIHLSVETDETQPRQLFLIVLQLIRSEKTGAAFLYKRVIIPVVLGEIQSSPS